MIDVSVFTSIGNRTENQDFIAYQTIGDEAGIFVVADGMGGYSYGDIAAKTVAEAVIENVAAHWHEEPPMAVLQQAIVYANESLALKRLALGCRQMGTCLCCTLIDDGVAHLAWIGDCRIYLYRNEKETYRTRDHSMVNELLKIKSLSASDMERFSNVVTRSIMGKAVLDPIDAVALDIAHGDKLLLCTDGLHKSMALPFHWDKELLASLLSRNDDFDDNASCLIISI